MDYWAGIFFWFCAFLRVELLYIWVTCDNISAMSGEYDTLILKSSCDKQISSIYLLLLYCIADNDMCVYPKMFLSVL